MAKRKRWQFILIVAVCLLTVFNILPTIFFYAKPLKQPIGESRAKGIGYQAINRVNALEKESVEWLTSYNKLLGIKGANISLDKENPGLLHLTFRKEQDAERFRIHISRAGALIPFVPSKLYLTPSTQNAKTVTLQRSIPIRFDLSKIDEIFQFSFKRDIEGKITPLYRKIVNDRLLQLGLALGGVSDNAQLTELALSQIGTSRSNEFLFLLANNILTYSKTFEEKSPIAKRYYATFTQGISEDKEVIIDRLLSSFERYKDQIRLERIEIEKTKERKKSQGEFLETELEQKLSLLKGREQLLSSSSEILRKNKVAFTQGAPSWDYATLNRLIENAKAPSVDSAQTLFIGKQNPLIEKCLIHWDTETIELVFHPDLIAYKAQITKEKGKASFSDQLDQLIFNEIARISRDTEEEITPSKGAYQIDLNSLADSKSFLMMDLGSLASKQADSLKTLIAKEWNPSYTDLTRELFPIWDYETFLSLSPQMQKLGLLIYTPAKYSEMPMRGFRTNAVYVIAKGIQEIIAKLKEDPSSPQAKAFMEDFNALRTLLQNNGFTSYPGDTYPLSSQFSKDVIFASNDFYRDVLMATREAFNTHGTRRYATLEFTNLQQRLLALNQIETKIHEDLLKWRDEYQIAQVRSDLQAKFDVPAPTKSPFWNNIKLSTAKYFRGDDRKILHWGLDLSGGKSVLIELRDQNNRIVTNETDIKQGISELYSRVNKMGVSEVVIRQEGSLISLDFPSAQGFSAADLVKSSSMFFHVVNEKFSLESPSLGTTVNQFLQEIWNEAVVTNRKDIDSVNEIAWKHLYGGISDNEMAQPISESAKALFNQGLRLSPSEDHSTTSAFNDSLSRIALYRGEDFSAWHGQTHPLLVVFKNYALQGANLSDVRVGYDPSKGNFLSFEVRSSETGKEGGKVNPRTTLYNWTSIFSKEKIAGTPLADYSAGRGWRMAVILNGTVINAPAIESPLRDHVSITGNFTQREASRLEADLKAGSLTFAPHILSEKNVSPELGLQDREMGILATILALILVIVLMSAYYRFAGIVASVAVLFNLLIIWATLQNIQATITLAGIAGIVLTMGMAVDANVLVFERIREEFALTGRLASSIHAGYRKAFSSIVDSNLTTIIAALILLHFDSGPIKGFALTLIIGIVSSMFTALFMTRYFFSAWVQSGKHTSLSMASWVGTRKINFLKYRKLSLAAVTCLILAGAFLVSMQKKSILGMDFTGGYALSIELQQQKEGDYRELVKNALIRAGAPQQDFQIKVLSPENHIKLLLSRTLDQKGKPFYLLPLEAASAEGKEYSYESNPRILWVVHALKESGLELTPSSLQKINTEWNSISGQMSKTMQNQAIIGLALALLCIMIYITVRFEFKYAISATIGLAIDVMVTLALIAILRLLGVPIQIDLNCIAALMTIIGYSLNDTIIIFDRIREDLKLMKKRSFSEIINHALNVTLSRTLMTSGTTLVVLLALLSLGGSTIFGLSLVMVIGVVFGTYSSLFVATPLLYFFYQREEATKEKPLLTHLTQKGEIEE